LEFKVGDIEVTVFPIGGVKLGLTQVARDTISLKLEKITGQRICASIKNGAQICWLADNSGQN
jgi:hypothetical protein